MRYATAENWAKYFQEIEGFQICVNTIRNKLREAGKIGITGRNKIGGLLNNRFFSESDVRCSCADLLQNLPRSDEAGFFIKDGLKYGTIEAWGRVLPITATNIARKLEISKTEGISGKTIQGVVRIYYTEKQIRDLSPELLGEDFPTADKDGFFILKGEKYGLPSSWSRVVPHSKGSIRIRLAKAKKEGVLGRIQNGRSHIFYSYSDLKEVFGDELGKVIPQSDMNSYFSKDGVAYRTIEAWAKLFKISIKSVRSRLAKISDKSMQGRKPNGQICDFYSESDFLETCGELMESLGQADKTGFFMKDGGKFGTVEAWSRILPISTPTINKKLQKSDKEGVKGKTFSSMIATFYSESDVREVLKDLLMGQEEKKAIAIQTLASHGIGDRQTLLALGSVQFAQTDFPPFGKGVALASAVLGETVNKLKLEHLELIADTLGFPKLTEVEKKQQCLSALVTHGIADRKSLIAFGLGQFIRTYFHPFGKGYSFASAVFGESVDSLKLVHLERIADVLFGKSESNPKSE